LWVAGRDRQNLHGRNAGFRGASDFVYQEAIHLVDVAAEWTLHRDFAVQVVVVTRERFGPDHTETVLANVVIGWSRYWDPLLRLRRQSGTDGENNQETV